VAIPTFVLQAAQPWAAAYSDHLMIRAIVTFCHFVGLMAGGGLAVAADRDTLRLAGGSEAARLAHLDELHATHRVVITGLVLTFASGVLMVGADIEAIATSWIFWVKMALIALLIANGVKMRRAERAARQAPASAWFRLHRTAVVSLVLWFLIVFVGTVLTLAA
jgi:hypothetical protein